MKLDLPKEWFLHRAKLEEGCESVECGIPPWKQPPERQEKPMKKIEIMFAKNGFILKAPNNAYVEEVEVFPALESVLKRIVELTGDLDSVVKVFVPRDDYAETGIAKSGMRSMTEWEHQVRDEVIKEHFQPTEAKPASETPTTNP